MRATRIRTSLGRRRERQTERKIDYPSGWEARGGTSRSWVRVAFET